MWIRESESLPVPFPRLPGAEFHRPSGESVGSQCQRAKVWTDRRKHMGFFDASQHDGLPHAVSFEQLESIC